LKLKSPIPLDLAAKKPATPAKLAQKIKLKIR
jgi:hypothetical protein